MSLVMLMLLATGLLQPTDIEKQVKEELDKLQGSWVLDAVETKGAPLPRDKIAHNVLVIKGDTFKSMSGEKVLNEATFTIDPSESPKWIDQTFKNKEGKLTVRPGLYELTGDTLRLIFDRERPKELKTTPESNLNLTVYKREKK